jgi:acyl-CoA synthetase (AMP-forming)/AMP-acid ligase II
MPPSEGLRGDLEFATLPGLVQAAAGRHGDRLFIEDGATQISFEELAGKVEEAARSLLSLGIEPGDRVAIWAPNCWEWIVTALAIHSTGGILVPINTRYKGHEAAWLLNASRAKALFTVTGFLATDYVALLEAAAEPTPTLTNTVVLRGPAPSGTESWGEFLERAEAIEAATARTRAHQVRPEDICDILFTSGTTGHPKGAMASHAQSLRAYRDWAHVVGLSVEDRYLVVAPFFHCFGYKAGWMAALLVGATVLPQPVFDVSQVLARIAPDRVSMLPGPPALYQSMLARSDLAEHDLSSLRLAVTGAAVIPVSLIQRMRDALGFQTIITGYGLTESTGIATMCRFDDDEETIATTSGRAIPGVEVRVVNDSNEEVAANEPGEVVIRGYTVMRGYFEDPEQTAATIDAGGWLHTGDIGVMNERGYLRITDRKKDMFIVGGFNAYPAEIENTICEHAAVAEVAVIGIPDPRLGEVGLAYVVVRSDSTLEPEALIAWCRERMANFKVPRQVELLETLPRNATGKIMKFVLRERFAMSAG